MVYVLLENSGCFLHGYCRCETRRLVEEKRMQIRRKEVPQFALTSRVRNKETH